MNRALLLLAAIATAAAAAGCNGASSARESEGVEASSATVSSARAPSATTPAERAAAPTSTQPLTEFATTNRGAALRPNASGIIDATFDDVKFPMEKTDTFAESMFTDRVKSLFGQRIRIRGYMFPTNRKRGLKQFVLVRDNMECCFGPGAALFDCVLVSMNEGATAEYTIRPIAVEGEFRFEALPGPDGRPMAIYQMKGETVE
jgi:hypothetical protein